MPKLNNINIAAASEPFSNLEFSYVNASTIQAGVATKAHARKAYITMWTLDGNQKVFEFTGTQNINLGVDGINGLETAAFASGEVSDFNYHVYALGKSDGTVAFLFVSYGDYGVDGGEGPGTGPSIDGAGDGWAVPAGYSYISNPAWYVRNASGDLIDFEDSNGYCAWEDGHGSQAVVSNGSATSYTDVTADLQKYAPPWAQVAKLRVYVGTGGSVNLSHNGSTNTLDTITMAAAANYDHVEWAGGSSLHYKRATANTYIQCQGWQR